VFCSIIQKASNALEVLKEVLDAISAQHPQVSQGPVILKAYFAFWNVTCSLF